MLEAGKSYTTVLNVDNVEDQGQAVKFEAGRSHANLSVDPSEFYIEKNERKLIRVTLTATKSEDFRGRVCFSTSLRLRLEACVIAKVAEVKKQSVIVGLTQLVL